MKPKWFPDWSNEICTIVASGPSAASVNLYRGVGKTRFVAVNNSWKIAPWSDFLFACDYRWWEGTKGCLEFGGWRVTTDRRAVDTWNLLRLVTTLSDDRLQFEDGKVGWGGNSGFQSLNMVVHFGCKRIILVGFDVTTKYGLHWHEPYTGVNNPTPSKTLRWQRSLDGAYPTLQNIGVKVINCSLQSRLKKYPKMSFDNALSLL